MIMKNKLKVAAEKAHGEVKSSQVPFGCCWAVVTCISKHHIPRHAAWSWGLVFVQEAKEATEDEEEDDHCEVEAVLRHRPPDAEKQSPDVEYQVKWAGYTDPSDWLKAEALNCDELLSAYWQKSEDVGRMIPKVICLPLLLSSIACLCRLPVLPSFAA